MSNPKLFDGRLALFYWKPSSIRETTITQFAQQVRNTAPSVNAILIKTNNGVGWEGKSDSSNPNLAINSLDDVQRWVQTLAAQGLECHAWCVVSGNMVNQEIDRIAEICLRGGVKSMLLDVEKYDSSTPVTDRVYFTGDQNAARAFATGLRQRVGSDFHLGLMFDARGAHPQALWVQSEWFPVVDSLHPLVYHHHFKRSAQQALQECYAAIGAWGKPVYPILQGYSPAGLPAYPLSDISLAAGLAMNVYHAGGLSIFRYGLGGGNGLGQTDLSELAKIKLAAAAPAPTVAAPAKAAAVSASAGAAPTLAILDPENERTGEFTLNYYGDPDQISPAWKVDRDVNGRPRVYRPAVYNDQTVYVGYQPHLTGKGKYAVEAFIPRDHADAPDAYYTIVDYPGGVRREVTALLNQAAFPNQWAPLVGTMANGALVNPPIKEYEFDPAFSDSGRVNLADITFIDPSTRPSKKFEVSFGAIRWRPVGTVVPSPVLPSVPTTPTSPTAPGVGGFDSPVGTDVERAGAFSTGKFGAYPLWVGKWYDATEIGTHYQLGKNPDGSIKWAYHTGADLNLQGGTTADKDAPVYAIADGRVTASLPTSVSHWTGDLVVIEHPVPGEDRVVYARYAHLRNVTVKSGDQVQRGQQIATIGPFTTTNYHLHFDISPDTILKTRPGHWPAGDLAQVQSHYIDPLDFIRKRHVAR